MPKRLIAYRNESYGPPNVTDKYAPLDDLDYTEVDGTFCARLLTNRSALLTAAGLLPQPLTLVMPNWQSAIDSEAGKNPPLVVISTNRSKWIKKGFDAVKGNEFENASDLTALLDYGDKGIAPPIYTPARIGDAGPRNVYIVVNISEYATYKSRLADYADSGVTIVGWSFRSPRGSDKRLSGFGASRFAAIEFCKTLRTQADEPWDYAWLMDDNVVALSSFAGYGAVERAMAAATPRRICAGFKGGSAAETFPAQRNYARAEIKERRGKQTEALGAVTTKGLLQQTVLWNIAYLTDLRLNFAPIFLESGEDVSFGHYFDLVRDPPPPPPPTALPYLYYNGIGVRKEEAGPDNTRGSKAIKEARAGFTAWVAAQEGANPTPAPAPASMPPPIKIKPQIKDTDEHVTDDSEQLLANFVVNSVIPYASEPIKAQAANAGTQNIAKCQAVEQTICEAMKAKILVDQRVLKQTFKINGTALQTVRRVDKP